VLLRRKLAAHREFKVGESNLMLESK